VENKFPVARDVMAPWETPSSKAQTVPGAIRPGPRAPSHLFRSLFLLIACCLGLSGAQADDVDVTIQTLPHGTYRVTGQFWTAASPDVVWATLTDYAHLKDFVPSLQTSEVIHSASGPLVIHQQSVARAMGVFSRKIDVVLNVHEQAPSLIDFEDISHHSFVSYRGQWSIHPLPTGGTSVDYHLDADPNFLAPAFVVRGAVGKDVSNLLAAVQDESPRRILKE